MGFTSWKTSDTVRSIPNMASDRPPIPVWMLLPSGKRAVHEPSYGGYGEFGGLDFFEETAIATLGRKATAGVDSGEVRCWGISLAYLGDRRTREELAEEEKGNALGDWLSTNPKGKVRMPRLVEKRAPYSSVKESPYCPEQGH